MKTPIYLYHSPTRGLIRTDPSIGYWTGDVSFEFGEITELHWLFGQEWFGESDMTRLVHEATTLEADRLIKIAEEESPYSIKLASMEGLMELAGKDTEFTDHLLVM
jgi:hypothetical protein